MKTSGDLGQDTQHWFRSLSYKKDSIVAKLWTISIRNNILEVSNYFL